VRAARGDALRAAGTVAALPALLAKVTREVRRERIVMVTSPASVTLTADYDAFDAALHGAIAEIAGRRDAAVWLTGAEASRPLHKAPRALFSTDGGRAVVEGWWPPTARAVGRDRAPGELIALQDLRRIARSRLLLRAIRSRRASMARG